MLYTPDAILGRIGPEKILARFHSLNTIYEARFQQKWPNTFLQKYILRHTVESYFCDLQHSKDFHDIELANRHKVAAFTMKWIVKMRPIQVQENSVPKTPAELLPNEIFALMAGLRFLSADITQLSASLLRSLLYMLHHRPIDAESLSATMYAIECGLNGSKP